MIAMPGDGLSVACTLSQTNGRSRALDYWCLG